MYNANKWQSIDTTNQESTCTGQKYGVVQVLALSVLYKTLGGYCTSTSSQVRVTNCMSRMQGIYTKNFLVYFFMVTKWPAFSLVAKWPAFSLVAKWPAFSLVAKWPVFSLVTISTFLVRHTISHDSLPMIDFNCMQWFYDISRAYCLFFLEFFNSLPKIFLSFSVKTSFQQLLSAYTRLI